MGAFDNISDRGAKRRWFRCASGSLVAALLVGFASLATADSADTERNLDRPETASKTVAIDETEAAVSTHPVALGMSGRSAEADPTAADSDVTPLTRAASRQRVAEMSPMSWLTSYGPVTIGRSK